jgi:hypothetical protein
MNHNSPQLSAYLAQIRAESDRMVSEIASTMIASGRDARTQVRMIEERIRSLERNNRLDFQGGVGRTRQVTEDRIVTSQARIAALDEANRGRRDRGEITSEEYVERRRRIQGLRTRFSEDNIRAGGEEIIGGMRGRHEENSLMLGYMRETLAAIRSGTQAEVQAARVNGQIVSEAVETPLTQLTGQFEREERDQQRQRQEAAKKKENEETPFGKFFKSLMFDRAGGMIASIPSAKNELEYIKPMMSTMGMMFGGLTGNLIDAVSGVKIAGFGLGQTSFGQLGTQFGEKLGEFAGTSMERTFKGRESLSSANFALKARVGKGVGDVDAFGWNGLGGNGLIRDLNQNLEKFGLTFEQASSLQLQLAVKMGGVGADLGGVSKNVMGLQSGLGVEKEVTMNLMELVRGNKNSDKDVAKIISGVLDRGEKGGLFQKGDRSFLSEFLSKNYMQLHKGLMGTQTRVESGLTLDILQKFDKIGGQFEARDGRSSNLIQTINSSLSNPQTDSMKALSFYIMRQTNPQMNVVDTQIEIQKGLGSKAYLQSMMKYLMGMGGDESYKINNVASAFGLQNNLAAAKELVEGYNKGTLGKEFLGGQLKGTNIESINQLGETQTSIYTQSTAEIQNSFVESALKGIGVVKDKMVGLFGEMMDGMEKYVKDEVGRRIEQGKNSVIKNNSSTSTNNDPLYRQWQHGKF